METFIDSWFKNGIFLENHQSAQKLCWHNKICNGWWVKNIMNTPTNLGHTYPNFHTTQMIDKNELIFFLTQRIQGQTKFLAAVCGFTKT